MIDVVPFKAEHLNYIRKNGMFDKKLQSHFTDEDSKAIEAHGGVYTIVDNGNPVMVGGILEYWKERAEAWVIFGQPQRKHFLKIFNVIKRFLSMTFLRRIEMVVACDFPEGHRMAKLLGFTVECERMKYYLPCGSDAALYVRIQK